MLTDLTARQSQLLNFIRKFTAKSGYPPTVREMADYMEVAFNNGVVCHLKALKKKGCVEWEPNKARSVRLTEEASSQIRGLPLVTLEAISESGRVI